MMNHNSVSQLGEEYQNSGESNSYFLWTDPTCQEQYSLCVHCGMCLESCPTYLETGHEHQSPRGRVYLITAVAQGKLKVNDAFADPIYSCLDCRACETACPAGVPVGTLIEEARGQIKLALPPTGWSKWIHHLFLYYLFPYPSRMKRMGQLLRFYQKSGLKWLLYKSKLLTLFPNLFTQLEAVLPEIKPPVLNRYPRIVKPDRKLKKRIGLFTGCIMDTLFSPVHEATIRVLVRNGYEVVLPPEQTCCGALHIHSGDREQGKRLAKKNIAAFLKADVDQIVVNSAGCGAALQEYPHWFRQHYEQDDIQQFANMVVDISQFLYEEGFEHPQTLLKERVTYHDACHLAHAQGVRQAPRSIIKSIGGVDLVEMPLADSCCGSAGVYNLTHPEMAEKILDQKLKNIPPDVNWVVMGNPGCMLQIAAGLKQARHPAQVMHTIQLLDWAYQLEHQPDQNDAQLESTSAKEG